MEQVRGPVSLAAVIQAVAIEQCSHQSIIRSINQSINQINHHHRHYTAVVGYALKVQYENLEIQQ